MSTFNDYLKPETLFSRDNALLKSAEKAHLTVFEALDKAARIQLELAEDLLDMNRERFQSLYEQRSFSDLLAVQQNLVTELGQRVSQYAGDLQEIVGTMRAGVGEAASDLVTDAEPPASKPKSKKAA